tara:strand:+ start:70 stop:420 length:351 start_codon:yes stop_codon:yes gene_type:complete
MSWKNILKAQPLTPEEEKEVQELMRFENLMREEAEKKIRRKAGKMARQRLPVGRMVKEDIEEEILEEVKEEGGALGMKNLKDIADKKKLKETISDMKEEGKLFEHKHGDFYTHQPK